MHYVYKIKWIYIFNRYDLKRFLQITLIIKKLYHDLT